MFQGGVVRISCFARMFTSPLVTRNRPLFSDFSGGGRSAEQVELAEAAVVFRRRGKRSQ